MVFSLIPRIPRNPIILRDLTQGGKSLETLITLMNQELHLLYIWLQSNKLTLNFQKNLLYDFP